MPGYLPTIRFSMWWLVFALVISSCLIEVNQSPVSVSLVAGTQNAIGTAALAKIPVTWAHLNLSGKLVYIAAANTTAKAAVQSLDLETGDLTTIFQVPQSGWVDAAAVAPDQQTLILLYSPPIEAVNGGQQSLYRMSSDSSEPPQFLVTPKNDQDLYFQPTWSPDGKYIYFAHVYYQSAVIYDIMRMAYPDGKYIYYVHFNYQDQPVQQDYPVYEIFRMAYPNGSPEKVADQAFWPRSSPDSSRLAYISMDPASGANKLFLANANGSNAQEVVRSGPWTPDVIDAPIFSPDGQSILFSTVSPTQSYQPNWFEKLLGVQVARAHTIPSDWWSVPLTGGVVTQLTDLQVPGLFASIALIKDI